MNNPVKINSVIGSARYHKLVKKRQRKNHYFKWLGMSAILLSLIFLMILLSTIIQSGYKTFVYNVVRLEIVLTPEKMKLAPNFSQQALEKVNYQAIVRQAFHGIFPDVTERSQQRQLHALLSSGAVYQVRNKVLANPQLVGQTLSVEVALSSLADQALKYPEMRLFKAEERKMTDLQYAFLDRLIENQQINTRFNIDFFKGADARDPELAGIGGAMIGSLLTMLVTLIFAFPVGVATAVYLEEFAPRNRFTDAIEVNINNLAAVPSIIYGLLGLAIFINFLGLPRSSPLVGGLVLGLMTLPVMIIASRAALRSVPPSIREAGYGMGASKMQVLGHHVLPLALPGMLTGAIIGVSRAFGETAPLLMIGMVAFIANIPQSPLDASTVLPVQVYLWSDTPERGFVERTSAAIMILLLCMILINLIAVILRKRFERRW